ncbi:PREDICTED: uncharacterized protein K02A2.6-like [Priapulus caudatus]|uniref:Uncharacterized protein K02A2.6-like n=1 Tax=Priapulus caudatus TaxID=37621 RepID=A0ABM1DPQ2_PRICU|nr:PREDICTED: uncharacterized protein K02A2.6-like [Priapulus caudatus]
MARLKDLTSQTTVTHLKSFFARHGVPETLMSDNGGQYTADEFARFARDYGFQHVTMSPHHSSGNGEVERAVKTLKGLLSSAADPYAALLCYRSTPLACGFSPAELLYNRRIRTKIPMVPEKLLPAVPDPVVLRGKEEHIRMQSKINFDRSHRARDLPSLEEGQEVYLPGRQETGVVDNKVHDRSYVVNTPTGQFRRNRVQINKLPETDSPDSPPPRLESPPAWERKLASGGSSVAREPPTYVTRSGRVSKPNPRYADT